jgi:hypothetical protein
MPNHVLQLDRLLAESLGQFVREIKRNNWQGKERDCVNRFAMGYLVPACSDQHFLKHPTQIGIEMAVGKPRRIGTNRSLPKDLVIWRKPWTTCWDENWRPSQAPLAVIEWKTSRGSKGGTKAAHDEAWLRAFSRTNEKSVGYSVSVAFPGPGIPCRVVAARFVRGDHDAEWFTA